MAVPPRHRPRLRDLLPFASAPATDSERLVSVGGSEGTPGDRIGPGGTVDAEGRADAADRTDAGSARG